MSISIGSLRKKPLFRIKCRDIDRCKSGAQYNQDKASNRCKLKHKIKLKDEQSNRL